MRNFPKSFEEYLTTLSANISLLEYFVLLLVTAGLSFLLERIYITYGQSVTNRRRFSGNFILLATTVMIVITVVKSSLALSLGLVGALSIVRFRAAIKEPEELTFLFLNIAIGLGMGAGQWQATIVGFIVVIAIVIVRSRYTGSLDDKNLLLTITSKGEYKVVVEKVVDLLRSHCSAVDLKRLDESEDVIEATFQIEFDDYEQLESSRKALFELDDSIRISFLDNRGLV